MPRLVRLLMKKALPFPISPKITSVWLGQMSATTSDTVWRFVIRMFLAGRSWGSGSVLAEQQAGGLAGDAQDAVIRLGCSHGDADALVGEDANGDGVVLEQGGQVSRVNAGVQPQEVRA